MPEIVKGISLKILEQLAKKKISAEKILNICVGNGRYESEMKKKKSVIFFLKNLAGQIGCCVELYRNLVKFYIHQAKGYQNKDSDESLKKEIKKVFKL